MVLSPRAQQIAACGQPYELRVVDSHCCDAIWRCRRNAQQITVCDQPCSDDQARDRAASCCVCKLGDLREHMCGLGAKRLTCGLGAKCFTSEACSSLLAALPGRTAKCLQISDCTGNACSVEKLLNLTLVACSNGPVCIEPPVVSACQAWEWNDALDKPTQKATPFADVHPQKGLLHPPPRKLPKGGRDSMKESLRALDNLMSSERNSRLQYPNTAAPAAAP
eukprot:scaffold142306_cov25-Tisochrysis_lutea.AAC.1